jgi:hypothetical protein
MNFKRYRHLQSKVNLDHQIRDFRKSFKKIKDHRATNAHYPLHELLMSVFAMFSLKYVSLLDFDTQTESERNNLKSIYGIKEVISDSGLRKVLDKVSWKSLRLLFKEQFIKLETLGILKSYEFLQDYLLVSVDGVEHFNSKNVQCDNCLRKNHKNGTVSHSHSMLCAVIVHPNESEVFVIGTEPIQQQDGCQKNDCERSASVRLINWLSSSYKDKKFLFLEDALYSTAPNIRQIRGNNWDFILNVKPDGNKYLFKMWETRKRLKERIFSYTCKENEVEYEFSYMNNVCINETNSDVRVNFLHCKQTDKKGKVTIFSWVTSLAIIPQNIMDIMRAGRSRWKIENETFNTLKNQSYRFEHNYGHGQENLSCVFAHLMLLAFLNDQIIQKCSTNFKTLWVATKTKTKLWEMIRSLFRVKNFKNFKELYADLGLLFKVQIT